MGTIDSYSGSDSGPETDPVLPLVIGTAGHVDHGKSALVEALTGVHPDRLREERERGMTIDLGFARFLLEDGRRAGIVDVPGHERFVKNMVAGASGVDAALFVVAADDGVMPQTREHLAILELLGVERGVIALTKTDLVAEDLRELAEEDVRELVRGTFLEGAPLVRTSTATGEGIGALARALRELLAGATPRSAGGVFRMPVQRVFSAAGLGTVVTGIPVSGSVAVGDELEVVPGSVRGPLRGRVRGLQAYHEPVERARAGHSTAIALSDVARADVRRGRVVARPGFFRASRLLAARVRALPGLARAVADRTPVRVHLGTAEALGELVLLDARALEPGGEALAQLRLVEPVACAAGDRFVLRRASPLVTLGGGVVLDDGVHRLKAGKPRVLADLARRESGLASPAALLEATLAREGFARLDAGELAVAIKRDADEVRALCAALEERGALVALPHGRWMHAQRLEEALAQLAAALDAWFAEHRHRERVDVLELRRATGLAQDLVDDLLVLAERRGLVAREAGGRVRRSGDDAPADVALEERAARTLAELERAGLQPPAPAELGARLGLAPADLAAVLELLVDRGRARRLGAVFFAETRLAEARAAVEENCRAHGGALDIPSLRDRLATSRKFLIPLLEAFDAEGLTLRQGARRVLRGGRGRPGS